MITNTTYRILVEKLGDSEPTQFIGNEGEVFYDPNNPILKLSDGTTLGGVSVGIGSYAQTLIVDPNGNDVTGNGGPNAPFQTLQKAHDYADVNIPVANQVVVKLNTGDHSGNLLVTRPNTHFVGPTQGVSKSTRISGIVTVSTASSVGGFASDMVSFENMLIVSSSGTSAVTIGGTIGCSVMFKDAYVFTGSSTAKCVDVTNTAASGVGIHMKNTQLQNQSSSGTTLNLSNTYYANLDLVTLFSGTGTSIDITTTNAVVYNTRIEKTGIGTAIVANSSFTVGKPSLILGNATIVNPTANSDGILVPSGSTVNIAQVAFNIAGTGFAVKGSAGSVVVNGNNLFVPGTTNKISTAITRVPLTTTFTSA